MSIIPAFVPSTIVLFSFVPSSFKLSGIFVPSAFMYMLEYESISEIFLMSLFIKTFSVEVSFFTLNVIYTSVSSPGCNIWSVDPLECLTFNASPFVPFIFSFSYSLCPVKLFSTFVAVILSIFP